MIDETLTLDPTTTDTETDIEAEADADNVAHAEPTEDPDKYRSARPGLDEVASERPPRHAVAPY